MAAVRRASFSSSSRARADSSVAGLVEQRAGAVQAGLGVGGERRWPRRPAPAASSSAAPVAPVEAVPTRQPVAPKRPPSRVTTTSSGWARAASTAADQPPRHGHGVAEERVEQGLDVGPGGADVGPDGLADAAGGAGARRAGGAEGEHGAGDGPVAGLVEDGQGGAGGVDAVDHDRGEGLAGGGLDGRLPAGVDLDQVEQRADDAGHRRPGARRRRRSGPRRGRGRGPRRGPSRRGARRRRRAGPRRPRPPGPRRRAAAASAAARRATSGLLGRLGARPRSARRRSASAVEALELLGRGRPGGRWPATSSASPRSRPAAQGGQLAAGLGGAAGERRARRRPTPGRRTAARWPSARLGDGQLLGLRREERGLGVGLGQLGGEAGGLGLEGGDDGLVDERAALALDAAPRAR